MLVQQQELEQDPSVCLFVRRVVLRVQLLAPAGRTVRSRGLKFAHRPDDALEQCTELVSYPCGFGLAHDTRWENDDFLPSCFNMGVFSLETGKTSKCAQHGCASELISQERNIGSIRGRRWRVGNFKT